MAPSGDAAGGAAASDVDQTPVEDSLNALVFYPTRLPVALGSDGQLVVVLDPGTMGAVAPLHLAYDPARLEVVAAEGGDLPIGDRSTRVTVTHTPALGWLTATWNGAATGPGTLVVLTVRPRVAGELPVIFAGPVGAAVARPATVVGLPAGTILRVTPEEAP